ncbi:MAG: hypothetical protein ACI9MC_003745 [Kiritimatiellia bacterium]|jgi:hypothetical protein
MDHVPDPILQALRDHLGVQSTRQATRILLESSHTGCSRMNPTSPTWQLAGQVRNHQPIIWHCNQANQQIGLLSFTARQTLAGWSRH